MRTRLVAAALVLAGCGGASGFSAEESACREFTDVAQDQVDGQLTVYELRDRFIDVVDSAEGTEVEDEAREVVAALTAGRPYETEVRALSAECDRTVSGRTRGG